MTAARVRSGVSAQARVALAFLGCAAFFFSWFFAPFHRAGDQVFYRQAYEIVRDLPLDQALEAYRSVVYSFEPIHFLICWLGSNAGVEKDLVMALFNAALACCGALFLHRRTGSLVLAIVLVVANYYLYAMFFTLEKLKIAFTFFMLFMVGDRRKASAWACLLLSLMAHFQMAIIVGAMLAGYASEAPADRAYARRTAILITALVLAPVVAAGFGPYILSKADFYLHYAAKPTIMDGILIGTLTGFTMLLSKQRRFAFVYSLVMSLAVLALGGDRLNMFFYFAFLGFVNFRSEISKMLALATLPYFLYKTFTYLQMVIQSGG